jgi:hypothetical protein
MITVQQIPVKEAEPWILVKHYAKRMPCVQYAFGLFEDNVLQGIVTYSPPPAPAIKQAIFGGEMQDIVFELNRLCIDTPMRNAASILVGRSLEMMPKPSCVVSYADGGQGHVGYIYQATNFLFIGAVTAHDCEFEINGVKTHGRALTDRGITNHIEWAKDNGVKMIKPMPKNRYVYFCGSKGQKKTMRKKLAYHAEPYPKGESRRYDASATVQKQGVFIL